MLLGFKRRFAPFVEEGSKTHTIRALRALRPRVGETCHCYVDPRQKTMRLLGRFECVKVEPIEIYERGSGTFGVVIAGEELTPDEKDALAWRDGFRSYNPSETGAFVEMIRYWVGTKRKVEINRVNRPTGEPWIPRPPFGTGVPLQFTGDLIHWLYTQDRRAPRGRWSARSSSRLCASGVTSTTTSSITKKPAPRARTWRGRCYRRSHAERHLPSNPDLAGERNSFVPAPALHVPGFLPKHAGPSRT